MTQVLYIEDSAVSTYIVQKMLKTLGYELIPAYDGAEGVVMAELHQPSLILTDLMLPDIHGIEIVKHLRQNPKFDQTPIVAVTASESTTIRDECLLAGCNDFLEKPVSQSRLLNTVEKYMVS